MALRPVSLRAISLALLVLLALAAIWIVLRHRSSVPRVVRLLPDGDVLFYANLRPLRQAGLLGHPAVPHAPSYAAFIRASGFDFERDADAVGLSMQGLPSGPHQTMLLLAARFPSRFFAYLAAQTGHAAQWRGHSLYSVQGPDGPLQILKLSRHLIAVTNARDRSAFSSVLTGYQDWWRAPAPPRLWQQLGAARPTTAVSWLALDYAGLASQLGGAPAPPAWLRLLRGSRTLLARLDADPERGVELSLTDFTLLPSAASAVNSRLRHLLDLYQQHAATDPNADPGVLALLHKVRFEQNGPQMRAIVSIPPAEVKALFAISPPPPAAPNRP